MNYSTQNLIQKRQTIVNAYFTDHYDFLYDCATRVLNKINRKDLTEDLINETFILLSPTGDTKLAELIVLSGMVESCAVQLIKTQVYWKGKFRRKFLDKRVDTISEINSFELLMVNDYQDEEIEYAKQLVIQEQMTYLWLKKEKLNPTQKRLFELMYERGFNSAPKLAKHLGLSESRCYQLMKALKEELKNGYNNNNL